MAVHFGFPLILAFCMLFAATQFSLGDDPKKTERPDITISPSRAWGNVFGDQEIEFKFRVDAVKAVKGKIVWRLAAGTATVKGGESELVANPNGPTDIAIKLPVPPVKDGVVAHTHLNVSAVEFGVRIKRSTLVSRDRTVGTRIYCSSTCNAPIGQRNGLPARASLGRTAALALIMRSASRRRGFSQGTFCPALARAAAVAK